MWPVFFCSWNPPSLLKFRDPRFSCQVDCVGETAHSDGTKWGPALPTVPRGRQSSVFTDSTEPPQARTQRLPFPRGILELLGRNPW